MTKSAWFTETFLPSFDGKMNNPKYLNSCILSERQADICKKYMERHQHKCSDYGHWFSTYQFDTDEWAYQLTFRGRYTFLSRYRREVNE